MNTLVINAVELDLAIMRYKAGAAHFALLLKCPSQTNKMA